MSGAALLRFFDVADSLRGIKSEDLRQRDKLDHVDTPLPAFEARDEGLMLPQPLGQTRLRHAGRFPLRDKQLDERPVPDRSKGISQCAASIDADFQIIWFRLS